MEKVMADTKADIKIHHSKRKFSTKQMVVIAMFSALSYVLMFLKFPISYLGFLEFEFSDIPALVAGLTYGPLTAVIIELIKNIIKVSTGSFTGGVGELANFIITASYMFTVCRLYKILRGKKKVVLSFAAGTIVMTLVGAIVNFFVLLPLYAAVFGGMDAILGLAAKTISSIDSVAMLVVIGISPFNIFKGIYVAFAGYWIYQLLRKVLQDA